MHFHHSDPLKYLYFHYVHLIQDLQVDLQDQGHQDQRVNQDPKAGPVQEVNQVNYFSY